MHFRFLLLFSFFWVSLTSGSLFSDSFEDSISSPTLTLVDVSNDNVYIQWDSIKRAVEYRVYYATEPFDKVNISDEQQLTQFVKNNNGEAITTRETNLSIRNLLASAQYYVIAKAKTSTLVSLASEPLRFSTSLSVIKNILADSSRIGHARMAWDVLPNAVSYKVYLFNNPVSDDQITKLGLPAVIGAAKPQVFTSQQPTLSIDKLTPAKEYYLVITAEINSVESLPSKVHSVVIKSGLNDTGVVHSEKTGEESDTICKASAIGRQDCYYGLDKDNPNDSDGVAGFSFDKLDKNGQVTQLNASSWSCIRDKNTGLIWEVKTPNNKNTRYHFYDPQYGGVQDPKDNPSDGGHDKIWAGVSGSTSTASYIEQINQQSLCGYRDWRLPEDHELRSIVHYGQSATNSGNDIVSVDARFFPETMPNDYWTSTPVFGSPTAQWSIYFGNGMDNSREKNTMRRVRLVRGNQ